MRVRAGFQTSIILVGGLAIGACSIDRAGLSSATGGAGSGGGAGGLPGTGGVTGTGGLTGTGGFTTVGTGGVAATGGATGGCDASTCPDGCCMGSRCLSGTNAQRCGRGGVACAPCPSCYRCSSDRACEVDPSSRWNVTCTSATISPAKPTGAAWDMQSAGINPLPDPYCQSVLDGMTQARTTTAFNTLTPMWNQSITTEAVTAEMLASQTNRFEVGVVDEDVGPMPVDPICSVSPHLTGADFAAGTAALPVTGSNCSSLTIQVECVP